MCREYPVRAYRGEARGASGGIQASCSSALKGLSFLPTRRAPMHRRSDVPDFPGPKRSLLQIALGVGLLCLLPGSRAAGQEPVRRDTIALDTTRVRQLPEINVTRTAEPLQRVPYAVGVVDRTEIQRGQQTVGLDEALNNLPGVVVANRYNFSLDQRISIRGAGSRSNFGVRGLKILLDGVPQTLPDGQSQLTNIDFASVERAEVLDRKSTRLNSSHSQISY